jgi:hypothetical protein
LFFDYGKFENKSNTTGVFEFDQESEGDGFREVNSKTIKWLTSESKSIIDQD